MRKTTECTKQFFFLESGKEVEVASRCVQQYTTEIIVSIKNHGKLNKNAQK